jgi:hypothetical protein
MRRFSWPLAANVALMHLITVLILWFMIIMNALGRAMAGMVALLTRGRAAAPGGPVDETALSILIQPAGMVIRRFDHLPIQWLVVILVLNSLLWGIVIAAVIGIFRKRRPKIVQAGTSLLK